MRAHTIGRWLGRLVAVAALAGGASLAATPALAGEAQPEAPISDDKVITVPADRAGSGSSIDDATWVGWIDDATWVESVDDATWVGWIDDATWVESVDDATWVGWIDDATWAESVDDATWV